MVTPSSDLDRDGELDVFEDWRVDYKERSRDLVTNGGLSLEFQLGLKMNPFSVGTPAKPWRIPPRLRWIWVIATSVSAP